MNEAIERWATRNDRSVLFDFNGTLSNDEPVLFRMYVEMFGEHLGYQLSEAEYYESLAGRSDPEIIHAVVNTHGDGTAATVERLLGEVDDRYRALVNERSPIEDETVALLDLLDTYRVPYGIVTGATRPSVEYVLAHRGIRPRFNVIVTEEDVVHGKPDPEGFFLGARQLAVEPESIMVFEDSLFGLAGASAAGMTTIGVVGTKTATELAAHADEVVDALTPAVLEEALKVSGR